MTETQLQIYCNGHNARMLGTPRDQAPDTLQKHWLYGWDSADGELYDRAVFGFYSVQARVRAEAGS